MPHGGADRIISDLCRHLPRRDWQVVLGLTQGARFNDVSNYRRVLGEDLPVVEIDGRSGERVGRLRSLQRVLRKEEPDVVLSMRVFDAYEAVAREKASTGRGPRLAVGVRGFEFAHFADLALYRESVDLCVSSGELIAAAAVHECGMDPERVVSIGGGVHPPERPARIRVRGGPIALLYAGRLDDADKGVFDLVELSTRLESLGLPFSLDIAGTGPDEAQLRERLDRFVQADAVRFHGWLSREQLYETIYPSADCVLNFSPREGITISPREAMSHGVVPVVSRFPGIRLEGQFVEGETALTFPVHDIAIAVECVRRLASEDGLLERLSANAARTQVGKYSFEGSMDAWAAALEDCLQRPMAVGPIPCLPERLDGRMSRWGVPPRLQAIARKLGGRRIRHASPGSEWPTASGQANESMRASLEAFARRVDEAAPA